METPTVMRQISNWKNEMAPAAAYSEKNLCLHQLIEEQAARTPDRVAVAFEQQTLTYGELDRRAGQLAHRLMELGAGPEVIVGLFVERSLEMMLGILGILKAGGAYVPIDTASPRERIEFMLTDAGVSLLLTLTGLQESLSAGAAQVVCLDAFDWTGPQVTARDVAAQVGPGNLAYVIYTSGSTGRPKGVCIEHGNIVNYVLGVAERLRLEPAMKYATVSTIAADLGNTVIFPALATGGCLHIISQERAEDGAMLSDYFAREKIDVLKIVPSHLAALQAGGNPQKVMPGSRLILGGESSRLDWIKRLRTLAPGCRIYNHYGPTEATVGVLTYRVDSRLPGTPSGTLPLGRPLPNTRIYILDERGQPLPAGVAGELYIGGCGVARGYLNRPDLTAEKFIPDPFSPVPGGRLYRTGDRARCLPDGNIEFCGRLDHQIKIHGHRVELGEVEAALRGQGGVRDAVVLAHEDESGDKQLAAYVVPKRADQALWETPKLYVLPDGLPVAHLNKNETDYIYNEIFVLQAYLRHGITVQDGDCIVDAGANIGLFTVFVSRLARNLRIFSFEPNPAAFACLKANAGAWGAAVKCFPIGLSRKDKSVEMTSFEGMSLLSGFYADAAAEREVVKAYVYNRESESRYSEQFAAEIGILIDGRFHARTESAQVRTLSGIIKEEGIERIDLLKINVEKSELDVLLGLAPDDWSRIRQLVLEVDQRENLEAVVDLLQGERYDVLAEQDPLLKSTELHYVYAIRPATGHRLVRQQAADAHLRSLPPPNREVLTPATLRNYLRERLPRYMIPSAFVLMEKFPLTPNGKIDRRTLPPPSYLKAGPAQDFIKPRTEAEKALASVWSEILKVREIGINDDFFDLGGHSLLAIRAVSRIREVFGVDLSIQILFANPTIAGLAGALKQAKDSEGSVSWPLLVPIKPEGSRPPLFLVHAAEGDVLLYRDLTQYLDPDQPVYGLQSENPQSVVVFNPRIEDMAAKYVKEILRVQPEGPYFLGGYCMGGAVAYEMARLLAAQGGAIAFLALMETYYLKAFDYPRALHCLWHKCQNVCFHLSNLLKLEGNEKWRFMRKKAVVEKNRLRLSLAANFGRLARALGVNGASGSRHIHVSRAHERALLRYSGGAFSGRITLFRPNKNFLGLEDPEMGWGSLAGGGVEIHELPIGPHAMLFEPFVQQLAKEIRQCIEKVSAQTRH